jgi:hypothetical protein
MSLNVHKEIIMQPVIEQLVGGKDRIAGTMVSSQQLIREPADH